MKKTAGFALSPWSKRSAAIGSTLLVVAFLVACGDDGNDFVSRPSDDSSSSVTPKSSSSEISESSCSSVKLSSSSGSTPEEYVDSSSVVTGTMTDERDGQTYRTTKIGDQVWMAENLNYAYTGVPYKVDGNTSDSISWCYDNDPANCAKYGRLYTWAAAMDSVGTWSANSQGCGCSSVCTPNYPVRGICPEGWHLPDEEEFMTLLTAVGGVLTAGIKLKSTSGWNNDGDGTDAFGFSALPAGDRYGDGGYGFAGDRVFYWSSTRSSNLADYMYLRGDYDRASMYANIENFALSVRCIKD